MEWQEETNSHYFTDKKQICDICGRESDMIIEITDQNKTTFKKACFNARRLCFQKLTRKIMDMFPDDEYVLMRILQFQLKKKENKQCQV